jgi:hypothetical protein
MTAHLDDLSLDALRLARLSSAPAPAEAERARHAAAEAHLASCASCRARAATLETEAAAFAARFDVVGLAAEALGRAEAERTARRGWLRGLAALSTAATAALGVVLVLRAPPDAPEALRPKGGEAALVEVFVLDGGRKAPLEGPVARDAELAVRIVPRTPSVPGAPAAPSPSRAHVRIVWRSAPEAWSALYPGPEDAAWQLDGPTWLERRVVLDGAPGPEALGVVACARAMSHAEAVRALADPRAGRADCATSLVPITKR